MMLRLGGATHDVPIYDLTLEVRPPPAVAAGQPISWRGVVAGSRPVADARHGGSARAGWLPGCVHGDARSRWIRPRTRRYVPRPVPVGCASLNSGSDHEHPFVPYFVPYMRQH